MGSAETIPFSRNPRTLTFGIAVKIAMTTFTHNNRYVCVCVSVSMCEHKTLLRVVLPSAEWVALRCLQFLASIPSHVLLL